MRPREPEPPRYKPTGLATNKNDAAQSSVCIRRALFVSLAERSGIKFRDRINHMALFKLFQLRKDRQSQNVQRGLLGFRKVSHSIAKVGKAFLQMKRYGVIDFAANAAFFQEIAQLVALFHANHILMVDVMRLR